ncbi:carbohydrate kinase [Sporormia fimetaria CBS 119925]|uniref:Gluconokinase n=1 Tax=Sporormia fimetaria CBS 119925 TaxID=1340428 RepID=A0A6A6V5Q7_9PLEO|nr:carbohydrate kinase [Sporormia fimetaria CBS 119925]
MLQTFEAPHSNSTRYASSSAAHTSATIATAAGTPAKQATEMKPPNHHHIFIVTGPAGCGKSTIAKFLAERYDFKFIEGDDFHPKANIEKMSANKPLNDADRWDWLIILRDEALRNLKDGAKGVVVTCSALKKKYRDVIRTARLYDEDPDAAVHFIYLKASFETLVSRVGSRKGHYMKEDMVKSQLADLEEPDKAESEKLQDVKVVDVSGTPPDVQNLAAAVVDEILAKDGNEEKTA